ncbi:MAG: hypothetical protein U0X41_06570 [Chitinophagales bacterium]|jgi:hypothetical protein
MENQLLDLDLLNNKEGKSLSALLMNGYETNSVEYIKKGFELFKMNVGGFIGFILLAFLLRMAGNFIPFASIFLIPLSMGMYVLAKKIDKNEPYQFSNFFDGYQKTGPLIGIAFLQGLIAIAIMLVFLLPFFLVVGFDFINEIETASASDTNFISFILLAFLMVIIILLVLVSWTFSGLILFFNERKVWDAMEISRKVITKKYLNWLGFLLLLGLINIAGCLFLFVGLLVTIPTTSCAIYVAYEEIIGLNLQD